MFLKDYQNSAVKKLLERSLDLLKHTGNKKLVFKAPTGSGKTIMMAEYLKKLVEDPNLEQPVAFIWTAPRQLHTQSKEKLEKYFEDSRALQCSSFEDLNDIKIDQNEILLFNWESINKEDNIYIRENERNDNLTTVIERTKEEGRTIILIIDESHHHATSDISQNIINDINPKLTIEVSATPIMESPDEVVNIDIEDVKAEGMIKKGVVLNEGFKNILEGNKIKTELGKSTDEIVIEQALKKRDEIVESYKAEGAKINPLLLIQLPNRKSQSDEDVKDRALRFLKDKHGISVDNGKLAIWLSGEYINKEEIEKQSSDVEVLLFKHAIALGWDCPRAHILVLFREWHSPIFSIQTVGRIMRMPEPDKGHYENDILNNAYVYTNLSDIDIQDEIAKDYITIHTSKRKPSYEALDLNSCHSLRHRETTRLSPIFARLFLEEAKKYNLKDQINIKNDGLNLRLISDWKAENIDAIGGTRIVGVAETNVTSYDLQRLFDYFVRNNLTPYHPEQRSVGRVKHTIYSFFNEIFVMDYADKQDDIIKITLAEGNIRHFIAVLNITKEQYGKQVVDKQLEISYDKKWNVPKRIRFNENYVMKDVRKSIMEPFFMGNIGRNEKAFIDTLENSKKVDWWFKNGDRDITYFAVPYNDKDPKPFYVDFIIKYKDGRVGLFDTKSGYTIDIAGPKIKGLREYLTIEAKKHKGLFGGIIANTDTNNYKGKWVLFSKNEKDLTNNFDEWADLDI